MVIDLRNCDSEIRELFDIFEQFVLQKKLYTGELVIKQREPIWK